MRATSKVGTLDVPRIVGGCWQLAGSHNVDLNRKEDETAFRNGLEAHVSNGLACFDTADIYGVSESFLGHFRKGIEEQGKPLTVMTKFCRGKPNMTLEAVETMIGNSIRALGVASLDLVAMHWWEFDDQGSDVAVAKHLVELQRKGKIRNIGVTNYDLPHLKRLVDAGVPVVSNQVQLSLLDRRPVLSGLAQYCAEQNIALLPYGSVGGGLLSKRWLNAKPPTRSQLDTSSLQMYMNSIRYFGDWALYQGLLNTMDTIANKHSVSIANVAHRWVLQQPAVAAVIVGLRDPKNVEENIRVESFSLDADDFAAINAILKQSTQQDGDVYNRERQR